MTPEGYVFGAVLALVCSAVTAVVVRGLNRREANHEAVPLVQYQLTIAVQRLDGIANRFENVVERVTRLEGLNERVDRIEARLDERDARRAG